MVYAGHVQTWMQVECEKRSSSCLFEQAQSECKTRTVVSLQPVKHSVDFEVIPGCAEGRVGSVVIDVCCHFLTAPSTLKHISFAFILNLSSHGSDI